MGNRAPAHRQRVDLPHERHKIDTAVTGWTPDALVHVNTVVEINEPGKIVNAGPLERLVIFPPTRPHRLQHGTVRPDLAVARDTGLGWRHTGERTRFYRCMTIPAIQSEAANVVLVAEGDRLVCGEFQHVLNRRKG